MKLTSYADYSLRLLMYCAVRREELVTIQEVADAYGISKNHLMKVAYELGRKGYLETVRGRGGGLRLARPPEKIGLGDVVRKVEEDFTMVECFDPQANQCVITGPCRLRGALSRALKAYLAVLDEYTLADLALGQPVLSRILLKAS
ncbi:MAG: Rrf2 family transcriptional regulator [Alphaproteobacteria bacterium]|nr:Rrf2 family transcriptional regulator [Alphaproteobacteria bacterium]